MAHAFDRKVMREIHYGNINTIATDFYGPGSGWGCDPKYVNYPEYDPAKAKALLKDYGKPVKFTFTTSSNPRFIILAQLYQGFWKKVGIDVDVKVLPEGASYNRLITGGKLDVWWATAAGRPDPSLVMMDLHSANKRSRYRTNNPRVDAAIEETRKAIRKPDRAKAIATMREPSPRSCRSYCTACCRTSISRASTSKGCAKIPPTSRSSPISGSTIAK